MVCDHSSPGLPGGQEVIPVETSGSEGGYGDSEGIPSSVAELDEEESPWLAPWAWTSGRREGWRVRADRLR
eukprot:2842091-Alexandrium_andersonii.AAC.1